MTVRRTLSAAGTTILVVLAAVLFLIALAPRFGYQATILTSGSMAPTVPAGGMVAVRNVTADEVRVGDVLTHRGYGARGLVTHRVIDAHDVDGRRHFITQGDANPVRDKHSVPPEGVVGVMVADLTPLAPLLTWVVGSNAKLLIPGLAGLWLAWSEIRQLRRRSRPPEDAGGTAAPPGRPVPPGPVALSSPRTPTPPPPQPPSWPRVTGKGVGVLGPPPPPPPAPPLPLVLISEPLFTRSQVPTDSDLSAAPARNPVRRGPLRFASVGLATVLAVSGFQVSAAVFTDVATVSAAEITSATLAPPTTVAAEFSCSSGEATITWTAAADADGYELHRRTGNSADFAAIGTTSSTSLTDTTVQLDTTYEYVVVATARSWTSDPSMPPAQLTTAASC